MGGRQHPVPFARRILGSERLHQRLGGTVAEGLVAAPDGIVIHRHGIREHVRKAVAEIPGADSGHPEAGHGFDLVKAQRQEFAEGDGVDVGIVGTGAVPGHEQRHALVQVVHDHGMPIEEHPADGLGGLVRELVRIAVDVHERVLGPVRRRLPRQRVPVRPALEIPVEPLDLLVAAVRIGYRIDENDHLLAYPANHGLIGNGEPISEFQHRLRGARLIRMQRCVEIIERPGLRNQRVGGFGSGRPGFGERRHRRFERRELLDAAFVGHRDEEDFAPLLGAADGEDLDARRRGRKRTAIGVSLRGIDQLPRSPGDPPEVGLGRGHRGGCRHVGHPGRGESGVRGRRGDGLHGARLGRVGGGLRTAQRRSSGKQNHEQNFGAHTSPANEQRASGRFSR